MKAAVCARQTPAVVDVDAHAPVSRKPKNLFAVHDLGSISTASIAASG
jgi:hypothetical protein